MSVKVRPYRGNRWEVDVIVRLPNGDTHRDRKVIANVSKSAAHRWGEERKRHVLIHGAGNQRQQRKVVPLFKEFANGRFIQEHAEANRQKPSGIAAKKTILRSHLIPRLGEKRLNAISTSDVERLKHDLVNKSPKTVNNVLSVLNMVLKKAVEWQVIDQMPCSIRLVKAPKTLAKFHDFDTFERLVTSSKGDWRSHLIVMLGGDAGLRLGEMMALEWRDVDHLNRQLRVERSQWKAHVRETKGGRGRVVALTHRLGESLKAYRHSLSDRVLCNDDGSPLTQKVVQDHVMRAANRAGVKDGVHILRHTFCSRLAMLGAPVRAIQDLAGHQDLSTTQRYMHVSPSVTADAIRLLDRSAIVEA